MGGTTSLHLHIIIQLREKGKNGSLWRSNRLKLQDREMKWISGKPKYHPRKYKIAIFVLLKMANSVKTPGDSKDSLYLKEYDS